MEIKSSLPVPESRPFLTYIHNWKTGGTSILEVLYGAKKCKIKGDNAYNDAVRNDFYKHKHKKDGIEYNWINDCFAQRNHTSYEYRKKSFIIGSVREPCSHYLSWFTYTSEGYGSLLKWVRRDPKFKKMIGKDAPFFNSSRDIRHFHKFLKYPQIVGRIHRHFSNHYEYEGRAEVDCWVFTDDLQVSLYECLRQYEVQGGVINWLDPSVIAFKKVVDKKLNERHLREQTKNDPIGNPQIKHHAPCHTYFDEESMNMIETGTDAVLYQMFGFERCCKGRTLNGSKISSSDEVQHEIHLPIKHTRKSFTSLVKQNKTIVEKVSYQEAIAIVIMTIVSTVMISLLFKRRNREAKYTPIILDERDFDDDENDDAFMRE